jgi:hypothetical protein
MVIAAAALGRLLLWLLLLQLREVTLGQVTNQSTLSAAAAADPAAGSADSAGSAGVTFIVLIGSNGSNSGSGQQQLLTTHDTYQPLHRCPVLLLLLLPKLLPKLLMLSHRVL